MLLPAFYARKDMKTPLKFSLIAIGVNIALNLILMWPLRQGGIALATVCSSAVNNLLLVWGLYKADLKVDLRPVGVTALKTLLASAVAVPLWWLYPRVREALANDWLSDDLLPLIFCASGFFLGYIVLCAVLRCPELKELFGAIVYRRKKQR